MTKTSSNPALSEAQEAALRAATRRALETAEGDSNDEEIDAWRGLAREAIALITTPGSDLIELRTTAQEAAEGESNDEEIGAWRDLAEAALEQLGINVWGIQEEIYEEIDDRAAPATFDPQLLPRSVLAARRLSDDSEEIFDLLPHLDAISDEEALALASDGGALPVRELIQRALGLDELPGDGQAWVDEDHIVAWVVLTRPHLREELIRHSEHFSAYPDILDDAVVSAQASWSELAPE